MPAVLAAAHPHLQRLLSRQGVDLFVRNAVASGACFLFDLALIWVLAERLGVPQVVAVTIGFLAANLIHYSLARAWIFPKSDRGLLAGYALFLGNSLVGLGVVLSGFLLLNALLGTPFLLARVLASVCAGTLVFVLNARLTFHAI